MKGWRATGSGLLLSFVMAASQGDSSYVSAKEAFRRPRAVPFPAQNRFTVEKYALGKSLFFDKQLSLRHDMACATCHNPELGWGDGRDKGVGFAGEKLTRRVPHLWNVAWGTTFFWDGRAASLEEQALGPIQNPKEMGLPIAELVVRLKRDPAYRAQFAKAFPFETTGSIRPETIAKALATFERSLVTKRSPFDAWVDGDENAMTRAQKRGFTLFTGKANCVQCHSGWNFTNGSFADIGFESTDRGRGLVLNDRDADYAFKVPTLRNLKGRNFFLHDGSATDLETLITNYDRGGNRHRPTAMLWLRPLELSPGEKNDLVQFLFSLTEAPGAGSISAGRLSRVAEKEVP